MTRGPSPAWGFGAGLLALLAAAAIPHAQPAPAARTIVVTETAGIRRTEYPVTARVEIARGTLADPARARLRYDGADVPAQFAAESSWDDGSVRMLSVDFNVSTGPGDARRYELQLGADAAPASPRGLTVGEQDDAIQVGPVRFSRGGAPLLASASYVKSELIGAGRSGLVVVDDRGASHDLSTARERSVEIVKRGPLKVLLRYTGQIAVDPAYGAPYVVLVEMPNSKSWVKVTSTVRDPQRRLKEIAFEVPLAFGALPWTWDLATENATYGVFRGEDDAAVLTQTVTGKGPAGWTVDTGRREKLQRYETSAASRASLAGGTGHLLDARAAVAFAVDRFGSGPGAWSIALDGRGRTRFSHAPAKPSAEHALTVYLHFVSAPVPIGAATSPASMLSPLRVDVK